MCVCEGKNPTRSGRKKPQWAAGGWAAAGQQMKNKIKGMLVETIAVWGMRIVSVLMVVVNVVVVAAMILPFGVVLPSVIVLPFVFILPFVIVLPFVVVILVLPFVFIGNAFVMVDAICVVPAIIPEMAVVGMNGAR